MSVEDDQNLLQIVQTRPDPDWLSVSREDPIEPDLPIIDAHHHFSEHWGGYMPADLIEDSQGHNVVATVYVQCGWNYRDGGLERMRPVGEVESVVDVTRQANSKQSKTNLAAAIVGFADLRLGDTVDDVLATQVAVGDGRFRGVRVNGTRHATFRFGILPRPPFHLYTDPMFKEGYACLGRHGLSFDAWVYHTQLDDVAELAAEFPSIPIVLNHLGGPIGVAGYQGNQDVTIKEWIPALKRVAQLPNITAKIGALGATVFGYDFVSRPAPPTSKELADAWRPLVEPVIETFGPDRCMFESNFPLDRSSGSYGVVWNAFKRLASGTNAEDKRSLFHDTARRAYRIGQ
ncbi:amidohydrolase family protein [Paraburkholderia sp. D1E]|uniref:amidohydrolase family protein n=1 Tax=Paraburkholderia sp. D1E TaxID=3461398 RepID=UPI0040467B80